MSNNESFIEEVSEEVRKDQLYKLMRRWGWIPILVILLLVGGAAWNEWRKAKETTAAQSTGDAILAAFEIEDGAERTQALAAIEAEGDRASLLAFMVATESLTADDVDGAKARLTALSTDSELPRIYRDLASLKLALLDQEASDADRRALLEPLAKGGAPFRLIAEEQLAHLDVKAGDAEAAIERLNAVLQDTDVSAGLRTRASQLIVALGGAPEGL